MSRPLANDPSMVPELTTTDLPQAWMSTLAKDRCRILLEELDETRPPVALETLAERVATEESGSPSDEAIREVRIALYHHLLPRMEDEGLLEYEYANGIIQTVRIAPAVPIT